MIRESWDRNWPYMICPACRKNIELPEWRFKCLFSVAGLPCLHCGAGIKLTGNLWRGYGAGALLLLTGGTLYSKGFANPFCLLFLVAGTLVIGWGLFTSRLVLVWPPENNPGNNPGGNAGNIPGNNPGNNKVPPAAKLR